MEFQKKKKKESPYFHGDVYKTEAALIRWNSNKITRHNASRVPPSNTTAHFALVDIHT